MTHNNASLLLKNISHNNSDVLKLKMPSQSLPALVCFSLIQVIGMVGNSLVILTICCERRLRTNYYFLVFHLAICDLSLAFFSNLNVSILSWVFTISWTSNKALCVLQVTTVNWLYNVELCFMILIAVLRHRTVAKPFQEALSRRRLMYLAALIYLLIYTIEIPNCFAFTSEEGRCVNSWEGSVAYKIYIISLAIGRFFLPMITMTVLYGKICHLLFLHGKLMRNIQDANDNAHRQAIVTARLSAAKQNRNTKILIVSIIIITSVGVSNLPIHVTSLLLHLNFVTNTNVGYLNFWILSLYFFGTCVINPIIYAFGDKTLQAGYKRALGKIITHCKPKKRRLHV